MTLSCIAQLKNCSSIEISRLGNVAFDFETLSSSGFHNCISHVSVCFIGVLVNNDAGAFGSKFDTYNAANVPATALQGLMNFSENAYNETA